MPPHLIKIILWLKPFTVGHWVWHTVNWKNNRYDTASKPGQVILINLVAFCLGHPDQTRFKNYLGLTQIYRGRGNKYGGATMLMMSSSAMPTFVIILWCLLVYGSHTSIVCVYIWPFKGFHKATPINWSLLQTPEVLYTLAVCRLHVAMLLCKARALDLHKATPTFCQHVTVPVNLLVTIYSAILHTYWSIVAIPSSYRGHIHSYIPAIFYWYKF